MIDFQKSSVFKLNPISLDRMLAPINNFIVEGEQILAAFASGRDQVVFTDKRIISANVKGMTGSKTDYTSIPYAKVSAFSVETAGVLDRDCELDLWVTAVGRVRFEIKGAFDIVSFNKVVSKYVLA